MPAPKTITYKGKTLTIHEWSVFLDVKEATIRQRLRTGMATHDVLSQLDFKRNWRIQLVQTSPNQAQIRADSRPWKLDAPRPAGGHQRSLTVDGVTRSLAEWSVISGISIPCIYYRLSRGATPSQAIAPKSKKKINLPGIQSAKRGIIYTRRTVLTHDGESLTVDEWAYRHSIPIARLLQRLKDGETLRDCLPKRKHPEPKKQAPAPASLRAPVMRVPTLAELDAMREAA